MTSSNKVHIIFFEQSIGCDSCAQTRRTLEQIAGSTDQVTLEPLNLVLDRQKAAEYGVDRVPAIILTAPGHDRIRYYGAPLGNELPTLTGAIQAMATGETTLTEQSRVRLRTLANRVTIQVFFTPLCVYCPRMISLANELTVENPLISATAIDAIEFPDLVRRYTVNGVPKTIINDSVEILGVASEEELVTTICQGLGVGY